MDFVLLGFTVLVASLILGLSEYMRRYVYRRVIEESFDTKLFTVKQMRQYIATWKKINIWYVVGVIVVTAFGYVNAVWGVEREIVLERLKIDSALIELKNDPEAYKSRFAPPEPVEEKPKALDQETYFYCLDRAAEGGKGLTPETVKACEGAATHYIIKKDVKIEDVNELYPLKFPYAINLNPK